MKEKPEILMRSQAARLLDVHPATLVRWELTGILVPTRNSRNGYREYTLDQLTRFAKNRKERLKAFRRP